MGVLRFNPPTLFLHTILFCIHLHRCCLPFPHQGNFRLFPPPHPYPCPLLPLLGLAQVQNQSRRNILRRRIMPLPNVGFHTLKPRLLSCRPHQGVLPYTVQPLQWNLTLKLPHHMVLGTPQETSHVGITTHIFPPKSLKKTDTCGLAPSLIRILVILLQTSCACVRLRITSGQ